jgi:hypothetical protein
MRRKIDVCSRTHDCIHLSIHHSIDLHRNNHVCSAAGGRPAGRSTRRTLDGSRHVRRPEATGEEELANQGDMHAFHTWYKLFISLIMPRGHSGLAPHHALRNTGSFIPESRKPSHGRFKQLNTRVLQARCKPAESIKKFVHVAS